VYWIGSIRAEAVGLWNSVHHVFPNPETRMAPMYSTISIGGAKPAHLTSFWQSMVLCRYLTRCRAACNSLSSLAVKQACFSKLSGLKACTAWETVENLPGYHLLLQKLSLPSKPTSALNKMKLWGKQTARNLWKVGFPTNFRCAAGWHIKPTETCQWIKGVPNLE